MTADRMSEEELRGGARRLGRKGGLKGGKARAAAMTPEQRSEAARKAAVARWDVDHIEVRITMGALVDSGELVEFSKRKFQLRKAWEQTENRKLTMSAEDLDRERKFLKKALDDLAALARKEQA